MNVENLRFDNYLTGNDHWVVLRTFDLPPKKLFLKLTNTDTTNFIDLVLYPIFEYFNFNLSVPVRALMHKIEFKNQNVVNQFDIEFKVELNDGTFDTVVLNKNFVKGFAQQYNSSRDYLLDNQILYIGEITYYGIEIYDYLLNFGVVIEYEILSGSQIQKYLVTDFSAITFRNKQFCNYAVVRFLNSLGGYQSFIFDSFEVTTKNKPEKIIPKSIEQFTDAGFHTIGSEVNTEIEFFSNSNQNENLILADMVHSNDVAWFDFINRMWIQLIPNSNTVNINNKDINVKNKLKFDFYTAVNNSQIW